MASVDETWDLEVDVVAVGSGLGGLTAAIVAHDLGRSVVVLEKAPVLGGVSAYSLGQVFVPQNHKMAEAGIVDSAADARSYLEFLAGGFADPELLEKLLETAPVAAQYLEERAGMRWQVIHDLPDYHYPHVPGALETGRYLEPAPFKGAELGEYQSLIASCPISLPGITSAEMIAFGGVTKVLSWDFDFVGKRLADGTLTCGPGMMAYLVKAAMLDRGIPVHLETPVRELLAEAGAVIGVRAERDGRPFRVRARNGVILGIGGFDGNPELVRYYEQLPEWHSAAPPFVEGDNMVLGGELGAAIAAVPCANLSLLFGYHKPGESHFGKPMYRLSLEGGYPHALWVNRAGQRFCDESFYRDYQPRVRAWDGLAQEYPNFPPYLIVDQSCRDKFPVLSFMPGQEIPEELMVRADTLPELAQKLGIDGEALSKTVERFNHFAARGEDPDFGRGRYPWAARMSGDGDLANPNLAPLEKAPYYGARLVPVGSGVNSAGLKTNGNAQVQHVRGRPIEGLYAVGNSAAPLDTGAGYQSGIANIRGIVGGFLAAQHAARQEPAR